MLHWIGMNKYQIVKVTFEDNRIKRRKVIRLKCSNTALRLDGEPDPTDTNRNFVTNTNINYVLYAYGEFKQVTKVSVINQPYITVVPKIITKFINLTQLDLSSNSICYLHWYIMEFTNIHLMDLSNNRLSYLPPVIGLLSNLRVLILRNNNLLNIPTSLLQLQNLNILDLTENPRLTSPSAQICADGKGAIFQFLRQRLGRSNLWSKYVSPYRKQYSSLSNQQIKSLLEHCVDVVLEYSINYVADDNLPLPLKRHLYQRELGRPKPLRVCKCSRCNKYFSTQRFFDNHDC